MSNTIWDLGVASGMSKIATVPGAVKQYRRALQGFKESAKTMVGGGPATKGHALHGTQEPWQLPSILEDKRIYASQIGPKGQHGTGAYWWRGFPRKYHQTGGGKSYLHSSTQEGIMSDLKSLPNKRPPTSNIYHGGAQKDELVTGPGDYRLRGASKGGKGRVTEGTRRGKPVYRKVKGRDGKMRTIADRPADSAIVDTATRAKDKTLPDVKSELRDQKLRSVDSEIFQKARRRMIAANKAKSGHGDLAPAPTKKDLVDLLKRRRKGEAR
jgi:hypothetical protein